MAFKREKPMIAGTDPVKKAKAAKSTDKKKGYMDALKDGFSVGKTASMKKKLDAYMGAIKTGWKAGKQKKQ